MDALRWHRDPLHPLDVGDRRELLAGALAIGCLWYLDALTTAWALANGAIELGPLAGLLVEQGIGALLMAKGAGLALVLALAWTLMAQGRTRLAQWSLGMVGALSIGIVLWNLLSILLLARLAP
ncbi:MAG TPA: DUF5658 family protein [Candidatus Thermoplasmatota archaeon]|nr:DUF5658 family protein [Candidatus Thermoplasmatota archaeon]